MKVYEVANSCATALFEDREDAERMISLSGSSAGFTISVREVLPSSRSPGCYTPLTENKTVKHDCGGESDESSRAVCEGMYADKVDDVIALCAALSEVYALAGEVNGVKEIVETAIEKHGV